MVLLMESVEDYWNDVMENKSDPRTRDWLLMRSPFATLLIVAVYVYFVKILGPNLMSQKEPFKLTKVLVVYNAFQVLLNAWVFYGLLVNAFLNGYNLRCEPVDYSTTPTALKLANIGWWFYISKLIDLFDTIFFVMRKNFRQISTLHVVHHGVMPLSMWLGIKFVPGGHGAFMVLLNSFVHVVMYTYYMLAAMGPKIQKYLWWKKYLTLLQMVQFVAIMVHALQLFFRNDCNYPMSFVYALIAHAFVFYLLFLNFYRNAYKNKQKKQT